MGDLDFTKVIFQVGHLGGFENIWKSIRMIGNQWSNVT